MKMLINLIKILKNMKIKKAYEDKGKELKKFGRKQQKI